MASERLVEEPHETITIELSEVVRAFLLLQELVSLHHEPIFFEGCTEEVSTRNDELYPDLHNANYHVVWSWIPPDIDKQFDEL